MNILRLTIKKKWFDMIASGEKKEEYREVKSYWIRRLLENKGEIESAIFDEFSTDIRNVFSRHSSLEAILNYFGFRIKEFDAIEFKNGYSKTSPTMLVEFKGLDIEEARPEWSDNWKGDVFRIKLGKILEANPSGLLDKSKKYNKTVNDVQSSLANV